MLTALWGPQFRDRLTEWESEFVASVTGQWETRRHLTDKQQAKLTQIWEEFASGRR